MIEYKDLRNLNNLWIKFEGEFKNGCKNGYGLLIFNEI